MAERIFEVYAKLDTPIEDDPRRSDRIIYNGRIYCLYSMYGPGAEPPSGEGWRLVRAKSRHIEGRRAHIFEVITDQE